MTRPAALSLIVSNPSAATSFCTLRTVFLPSTTVPSSRETRLRSTASGVRWAVLIRSCGSTALRMARAVWLPKRNEASIFVSCLVTYTCSSLSLSRKAWMWRPPSIQLVAMSGWRWWMAPSRMFSSNFSGLVRSSTPTTSIRSSRSWSIQACLPWIPLSTRFRRGSTARCSRMLNFWKPCRIRPLSKPPISPAPM